MIATLFDFNGVLVDDEQVHLEAFRAVLAPLRIAIDARAYEERYLGFDDAGAFRAILEDAGHAVTEARVAALIDAKKPEYRRRVEAELRIFPGAAAIVRRRAARGTVGVVSGALREEIVYCLERMGVSDVVSFIVAAEDTNACKPDPEGYRLAQKALEATAKGASAVVVEDSLAGVVAAKKAGLRCVAVAHSYDAGALRAAGADAVVDAIANLDDATIEGDFR